jgi:hypothetical protein
MLTDKESQVLFLTEIKESLMNILESNQATMSRAEFCKAVGISLVTEWRLRQAGKLSHYQIGDKILYSHKHIDEFLASHEKRAAAARR